MMNERRRYWLIGGGVIVLASLAFVTGRGVETRRIANASHVSKPSDNAPTASPTKPPLRFEPTEIADVPFADLYEQLCFSSRETRLAIGESIKAMPEGAAKEAARFTYNKLMVQIAPADSAKSILDIPEDGETLHTAIVAAPLSAMELFAPIILKLPNTGDASLGRVMAFSDVMEKWSRVDPEAAARFLQNNYQDASDFSVFAATVVQNWAAVDPQSAMKWMAKLDSAGGFDLMTITSGLLDGWYQNDPNAAINYAVAHASEEDFELANRDFADTIFCSSPEAAAAFIKRLPVDQRAYVVDYVGSVIRGDLPNGGPPPREMAKWLMQFPPEVWEKPLPNLINKWKDSDPEEFFAWTEQFPPDIQDRIVANYSGANGNYVPDSDQVEKDLSLAATVSDSQLREKLMRQLVCQFSSTFKEDKVVIQQLPISQEEKKSLLQLIGSE
jgi:hypothetical protein